MNDGPEDVAKALEAIGRIEVVPTLLAVLCEITGMRFSVVACVTETTWTACAVQDEIGFGVRRGDQLAANTTLCFESRASRAPIVIEHASTDPLYHAHPAVKLHAIESQISVPIVLSNGRYFGNLCAIDPSPAKVKEPRILSMFTLFASLIASQLETQMRHEQATTALLDEREAGELREQFIAILGHDLRNPLQAVYAGCELLEQKIADPRLSAIASRIKTNVRRMSALIDDVLDFARGRLGGGLNVELTEVESINFALMTVVQEVLDARPDCKIISNIDVGRPVRCDLGRLQQVASNLLTNAAMHGLPHGSIKITGGVECRRTYSIGKHRQDFSAVLASFGIRQSKRPWVGPAHLLADRSGSQGQHLGHIERGGWHPIHRTPAVGSVAESEGIHCERIAQRGSAPTPIRPRRLRRAQSYFPQPARDAKIRSCSPNPF
jgi:GAF domain-containing protein